jgi:hypothetical protein
MRRDQLEHAIRTACQIIEHPAVVVVGSQSILGTFTEDELPPEATMSIEIDILPLAADNDETARLADLIEGIAGEWSSFEEQHGFIDHLDDHARVELVDQPGGRAVGDWCAPVRRRGAAVVEGHGLSAGC